jgi:hypothetical protein
MVLVVEGGMAEGFDEKKNCNGESRSGGDKKVRRREELSS